MENRKNHNASSPHRVVGNHINNNRHYLRESHHEAILHSTSLLIIVILVLIVVLLLAISLLIAMLRKLQNATSAPMCSRTIITSNNCKFSAHTHSIIKINSNTVAELNGRGCKNSSNVDGKWRGVQVLTIREVESATNNFSEANLIGDGVYRGILRDGNLAAIKILQKHGSHWERAFRSQVDLLSQLRSPYLSQLLGYCADQNNRILVFEYMSNGSLQKHLNLNKSRIMDWGVRLKIALDCARALEYLHEHTTPAVIHRNLNCSNILLDQNYRAKLSGFGLAKIGSDKLHAIISTRVLGTTGYLAPEYVATGKLSTKSDVYSYGIILLQLLTGRLPIDSTRPPGEHILVSWALPHLTNRDKLMKVIDPTLQDQYCKKDLIQVAAIAAMCVQNDADYRPLMVDVVQSLIPLVKNPNGLPSNSPRSNPSKSPIP